MSSRCRRRVIAEDDASGEEPLTIVAAGGVVAWELWQRGDALELKDPMLGSTCDVQQFLRTVHVALLCVQDSATDRPTTSDMISMLLNDTILLPTPNTPPLAMVRAQSMSTSDERKPKPIDLSINNISITVMNGR
ncbi:S-receptor kinase-like protein 1 [Artemisia annua]|uniref:S-receptor kinase-like protein 1 n=1 Tax=Artemisia annua TaxID=35608 RepID=A0A2U1N4M5_ARTAN|nr:S-receptor kinase-like protein 1 [Artemisia annua]